MVPCSVQENLRGLLSLEFVWDSRRPVVTPNLPCPQFLGNGNRGMAFEEASVFLAHNKHFLIPDHGTPGTEPSASDPLRVGKSGFRVLTWQRSRSLFLEGHSPVR